MKTYSNQIFYKLLFLMTTEVNLINTLSNHIVKTVLKVMCFIRILYKFYRKIILFSCLNYKKINVI